MAKEQQTSIDLVTVELSEEKIAEIKEQNSTLNNLMTQIGQLHIRKNELNEELSKIDNAFIQAEDGFKETNTGMRKVLNKLEKEYPRGQLDLEKGTITYNKAFKEQIQQQQAQSNGVDGGEVVDAPFSKV